MRVAAHQPNFLPGESVITKVEESDAVIWLDEVQYTKGGWSNRNRMPDGSWLTVPVDRETDMAAFNRVRLSEHGGWRRKAVLTLAQHYGPEIASWLSVELGRPYRSLVGLNLALLRQVCRLREISTPWHFQSHLDGGHAVTAVSDNAIELLPISERLAMMVSELGGDVYVSGPSGRNYLNEIPFHQRGIDVEYYHWSGENTCCVAAL